jgi:sodium pump decarboxylase gamma subunit
MDNLGFGLQVTVLGLGIVFGLLIVLWLLLTLVLRLEARARSVPGSAAERPPETISVRSRDGREPPDPRLVAGIAVAVARHVEQQRRQAAPVMRSYWPGSLLFASRWVSAGRTRQGQSWHRRVR